MIPVIAKHQSVNGIIDYHERKVKNGTAELIYNGTASMDGEEFKKELNAIGDMKPGSRDRYLHVSLSLAKNEALDDETWNDLVHDYMDHMGYEESPYLIYKHDDKEYDHVHLVMPRVKENGKFIDCFQDHYQSEITARLLEKKFQLMETIYNARVSESIREKNARKYGLYQGIHRYIEDSKENEINPNEDFKEIAIPEKVKDAYTASLDTGKAITHYEISQLFVLEDGKPRSKPLLDHKAFKKFCQEMEVNGYYQRSNKDIFVEKLYEIKYASKSYDEFTQKLNEKGY